MIGSKFPIVPSYLINLVNIVLEKEIQKRTGILLSLLNPEDFVDDIHNPIMMMYGQQDELTKMDSFLQMFEKIPSKNKKIEIFVGNHTDE